MAVFMRPAREVELWLTKLFQVLSSANSTAVQRSTTQLGSCSSLCSPCAWMSPSNYTQATTGAGNHHPPCRILAQDRSQALKSPCVPPPSLARSRKLQTGKQVGGASSKWFSSENQLLKSALSLHKLKTQLNMGNQCFLHMINQAVVEEGAGNKI